MKINERWSIAKGNDCFVVVEARQGRNPKTGEATTTESRTFHPTIEQCARKIVRSETLDQAEQDDLWQAVMNIQKATNRFIDAIQEQSA